MKKMLLLVAVFAGLALGCATPHYTPIPSASIEKPSDPIPIEMVKVVVTDPATGEQSVIYGIWEKDLGKLEYNIRDARKYNWRCFELIGADKDSD